MLDNTDTDQQTIDEPQEIEETTLMAAKYYRDQFAIHNFS